MAQLPQVSLSSTNAVFGTQTVGTTSAPQTVTIQNVGNLALTIAMITSFNAEFLIVNNTCPASLGPGPSCTFGVTFKPAAVGTRTGFGMIADNAGDSPQSINLRGTGN